MLRRVLLPILLCLLSACATYDARAPVGDRTAKPAQIPASHTVRIGDTLFSVAFLYGLSVQEIAAWNGLREPYTIYGGQKLRLTPPPKTAPKPVASSQPQPAPSRPQPAPSVPKVQASQPMPVWSQVPTSQPKTDSPRAAAGTAPAAPPRTAKAAPAAQPEPAFATNIVWGWPAEGRLVRTYDANSAGKKGIDISGKTGDDVRAAAAGKVVYAGSGLSGYGRLIIIKHNNDFLSAYAHNRELIATEGQWVKLNEVIARMGSSGTNRTALHFEIRKQGRPVDPLRYLPRR